MILVPDRINLAHPQLQDCQLILDPNVNTGGGVLWDSGQYQCHGNIKSNWTWTSSPHGAGLISNGNDNANSAIEIPECTAINPFLGGWEGYTLIFYAYYGSVVSGDAIITKTDNNNQRLPYGLTVLSDFTFRMYAGGTQVSYYSTGVAIGQDDLIFSASVYDVNSGYGYFHYKKNADSFVNDTTGHFFNSAFRDSSNNPLHIGFWNLTNRAAPMKIVQVRLYRNALTYEQIVKIYDDIYAPWRQDDIGNVTGVQTLLPTGIPSAEAIGTADIWRSIQDIEPLGIPSAEAVGAHTLSTIYDIEPLGVPSAETIGNQTIQPGPTDIDPLGIPSAEAIGTQTIEPENTVLPAGIVSEEAVGNQLIELAGGTLTVQTNSVLSQEAIGIADVWLQTFYIEPTGIPSAETIGTQTIDPESTVMPTGIPSAEAVGTQAISVVSPTLFMSGIPSAEAIGSATVERSLQTISMTGVPSEETIGSAFISSTGALGDLVGIVKFYPALGGKVRFN